MYDVMAYKDLSYYSVAGSSPATLPLIPLQRRIECQAVEELRGINSQSAWNSTSNSLSFAFRTPCPGPAVGYLKETPMSALPGRMGAAF